MQARWTVIWKGQTCSAFYTRDRDWSMDPTDAAVYESWFLARLHAGLQRGVSVARCWV